MQIQWNSRYITKKLKAYSSPQLKQWKERCFYEETIDGHMDINDYTFIGVPAGRNECGGGKG